MIEERTMYWIDQEEGSGIYNTKFLYLYLKCWIVVEDRNAIVKQIAPNENRAVTWYENSDPCFQICTQKPCKYYWQQECADLSCRIDYRISYFEGDSCVYTF
jgi:hypothetical protein